MTNVIGTCDPAYPTMCIPPPPPALGCPDVLPFQGFPVLAPDPQQLDRDRNGIGCDEPAAAG